MNVLWSIQRAWTSYNEKVPATTRALIGLVVAILGCLGMIFSNQLAAALS